MTAAREGDPARPIDREMVRSSTRSSSDRQADHRRVRGKRRRSSNAPKSRCRLCAGTGFQPQSRPEGRQHRLSLDVPRRLRDRRCPRDRHSTPCTMRNCASDAGVLISFACCTPRIVKGARASIEGNSTTTTGGCRRYPREPRWRLLGRGSVPPCLGDDCGERAV